MPRSHKFLGDISWFQVVAGALAAMTAAWIASSLGVAGTIIGAAVASLTLTISSAFYRNTLDRTRTLIVQTDSGTRVEREVEPGEVGEALAEVAEAEGDVRGAEVVDSKRRVPWRTLVISTVATLVLAFGGIGAYELVSDRAFGTDPDNARIGSPFSGGGTGATQQDDGGTADSDADADAGGDVPAEQAPTPAPTVSPSPTAPAPAPRPTATVPPPVEPAE